MTGPQHLSSAVATGSIRGLGAGVELGFLWCAAWALGAAEAGMFLVAFSVLGPGLALSRVGLDSLVVRDLARCLSERRTAELPGRAFSVLVVQLVPAGLVALSLAGLAQAPWVQAVLGAGPSRALGILAWAVPVQAALLLGSDILKGLGHPKASQLFYGWPSLVIPLVGLTVLAVRDAEALARLYVTSAGVCAAVVALAALVAIASASSRGGPLWIPPDWSGLGRLAWIRPLALLTQAVPVWILNLTLGPASAGAFAVLNRFAAALTMAPIAVEAIAAPRFSREQAATPVLRAATLRRAQRQSFVLALALAALVAAVLGGAIHFQSHPLGIEAMPVLGVLVLGYLANGYWAPLGSFAAMTGNERLALGSGGLALVVTACGTVLLLPLAGGPMAGALALGAGFCLRGLFLEHGVARALQVPA